MGTSRLLHFDIDQATVRTELVRHCAAISAPSDNLVLPVDVAHLSGITLEVELSDDGMGGTRLHRVPPRPLDLPFFSWALRPIVARARRRRYREATALLRTREKRGFLPPPCTRRSSDPDAVFNHHQATLLSSTAAVIAIVTFGGALFGQHAHLVANAFDVSDASLGVSLAVIRGGVLIVLLAGTLADRRGRRVVILLGLVGSCLCNALSALAPSMATLTAAQTLQRGLLATTVTIAGIAAIEEAPEGARAFTTSMLGLSAGFGYGFAVASVPIADLGPQAWRIGHLVGASTLVFFPSLLRHLRETTRFHELSTHAEIPRGKMSEVLDHTYGRRFVLLAIVGFLTNVFSAPSSQYLNTYLTDEHHFAGLDIAIFRGVTSMVPGVVGLLLAGHLAERFGRKPVAIITLLAATLAQMGFFWSTGPVIWIAGAIAVTAAAGTAVSLGTLDTELFPTETRGTSNGMLIVVSVVGSATGLLLAGFLADQLGGIGHAITWCGLASLLAVLVVFRLPESRAHSLEELSPSEPVTR